MTPGECVSSSGSFSATGTPSDSQIASSDRPSSRAGSESPRSAFGRIFCGNGPAPRTGSVWETSKTLTILKEQSSRALSARLVLDGADDGRGYLEALLAAPDLPAEVPPGPVPRHAGGVRPLGQDQERVVGRVEVEPGGEGEVALERLAVQHLLDGGVEQDLRRGFSFLVQRVRDLEETLSETAEAMPAPRAVPASGAFVRARIRFERISATTFA